MKTLLVCAAFLGAAIAAPVLINQNYSGPLVSLPNTALKVHPDPWNVYEATNEIVVTPGTTTFTIDLFVDLDNNGQHDPGQGPGALMTIEDLQIRTISGTPGPIPWHAEFLDPAGNVRWFHIFGGANTSFAYSGFRLTPEPFMVMDVSPQPMRVRFTFQSGWSSGQGNVQIMIRGRLINR